MRIARRIESITPSATIGMKVKGDALKAQGKDVLSFALGEPDFPTPANIVAAAERHGRGVGPGTPTPPVCPNSRTPSAPPPGAIS